MRDSWKIASLSDVCYIKPPKNEARQKLSGTDNVSFVPMNDLGVRQKFLKPKTEKKFFEVSGSYTYFANGDVLLAKITPCFENGKIGIATGLTNGVGFGSSEFIVFRPRDELDPEYLFYFLSQDSFRDSGARVMSGAVGHKRLPKEFIESCQIPFPPLPEQKRIVAILDEAFEGINKAVANTEKNLANAHEVFESYLNSIVRTPKTDWKPSTISDACYFYNGKPHEKITDSHGKYIIINSKFISSEGKINKKVAKILFPLYKDDIVMVMSDVPKGKALAKCFLIDKNNMYSLNQRICCIRSKYFNKKFLFYQINRNPYLLTFDNKENQTNLRKDDILKCPLWIPDIDEQNIIANKLDEFSGNIKSLESIYRQKLAALAELKQSLLQKAFSGELTAKASNHIEKAAA